MADRGTRGQRDFDRAVEGWAFRSPESLRESLELYRSLFRKLELALGVPDQMRRDRMSAIELAAGSLRGT